MRSAHTSTTVRTRDGGSWPNEVLWSDVKHTTSALPRPGARATIGIPSTVGGRSGTPCANDGNRFSNTATS